MGSREVSFSWRRGGILLAILFAFVLLYNVVPRGTPRPNIPSPLAKSTQTSSHLSFGDPSGDNDWFDGLTDAQCGAEFPDLYQDIDRAVAYWRRQNRNISADDLSIAKARAAIRILIHNNEIRILESKDSVDPVYAQHDRAYGVLNMIQRALIGATAVGEHFPTVEIALSFQDDVDYLENEDDHRSYWAFARTLAKQSHQRSWLMPNFDFWYYHMTGSFSDAKRAAMRHDGPFTKKIQKLVWRGSPNYGPDLRNALIKATAGKDWADVVPVLMIEDPPIVVPADQFCKYAMTVYTEGVTYSGRLKFLLNCQSLLFVHDTEYATHYSHLLEKGGLKQNYVAVKRDWSDLEEKVRWYLQRPDEAEKIIANSLATFRSRYNTRAAISCYLRRLIRGYASVSYTPEISVARKDGSGPQLRGWSYEKFMDTPVDKNFEQLE